MSVSEGQADSLEMETGRGKRVQWMPVLPVEIVQVS